MSQHSWLPIVPESLVKLQIRCGFVSASFFLPLSPLAFLSLPVAGLYQWDLNDTRHP